MSVCCSMLHPLNAASPPLCCECGSTQDSKCFQTFQMFWSVWKIPVMNSVIPPNWSYFLLLFLCVQIGFFKAPRGPTVISWGCSSDLCWIKNLGNVKDIRQESIWGNPPGGRHLAKHCGSAASAKKLHPSVIQCLSEASCQEKYKSISAIPSRPSYRVWTPFLGVPH